MIPSQSFAHSCVPADFGPCCTHFFDMVGNKGREGSCGHERVLVRPSCTVCWIFSRTLLVLNHWQPGIWPRCPGLHALPASHAPPYCAQAQQCCQQELFHHIDGKTNPSACWVPVLLSRCVPPGDNILQRIGVCLAFCWWFGMSVSVS